MCLTVVSIRNQIHNFIIYLVFSKHTQTCLILILLVLRCLILWTTEVFNQTWSRKTSQKEDDHRWWILYLEITWENWGKQHLWSTSQSRSSAETPSHSPIRSDLKHNHIQSVYTPDVHHRTDVDHRSDSDLHHIFTRVCLYSRCSSQDRCRSQIRFRSPSHLHKSLFILQMFITGQM